MLVLLVVNSSDQPRSLHALIRYSSTFAWSCFSFFLSSAQLAAVAYTAGGGIIPPRIKIYQSLDPEHATIAVASILTRVYGERSGQQTRLKIIV